MLTHREIVVNFAGVRTVQLLEGAAISVARKIISRTCFGQAPKPTTRTHSVYCFENELSDEVFGVEEIWAVTLDDSQLVTLRLESGNYLHFQPDTRAQCNVVPLHVYKKATKDVKWYNVTPVNMVIISYRGTSSPILGKVRLRVWRGDFRCLVHCNLVDSKIARPILGRKACLVMNIIQYLDNDQLNRPQESGSELYTHDVPASSPVSADQLIKSFPCVFADGMGALAGEYHMVQYHLAEFQLRSVNVLERRWKI